MEALDAAWEMGLDLEGAMLQQTDLIILMLDYSNFLDNFTYSIIWPLAEAMGCPPMIVRMMTSL